MLYAIICVLKYKIGLKNFMTWEDFTVISAHFLRNFDYFYKFKNMLLTLPMRTEDNDCGYICVDDRSLQLYVNGSRIGNPSPRMDSEVFAERYGHIGM